MKILFENTTIYTKNIFMEAQRKWYQKNALKKRWFYLLIAAFCFVCAYYYATKSSLPAGIVFAVMGLLLILVYFKGYLLSANKAYKEQAPVFPKDGFKWMITKDKMSWKTTETERAVFYKDVQKVYESTHAFIILTKGKMHILDKAGFTTGTVLDFKKFMKKKSPGAFK